MKSLVATTIALWVLMSSAGWCQEAPLSDATQE